MTYVKLSADVRITQTGEITTISKLLADGRVELREAPNWRDRGHSKYFAELKNGDGCWEISEMAFKTRKGLPLPSFTEE